MIRWSLSKRMALQPTGRQQLVHLVLPHLVHQSEEKLEAQYFRVREGAILLPVFVLRRTRFNMHMTHVCRKQYKRVGGGERCAVAYINTSIGSSPVDTHKIGHRPQITVRRLSWLANTAKTNGGVLSCFSDEDS